MRNNYTLLHDFAVVANQVYNSVAGDSAADEE